MKAKLLLVIVLVVLVVGGTFVTVAMLNAPATVAANALGGLAKDALERDEIKPFCELFTSGSIEASLDGMKVDGYDSFGDSSISGKLYFSEDAFMLKNVKVNLADGDVKLNGDAYISEDVVYVNEQEILGGAYGIKISTLADDLANSIFAADSGSEYALDKETYDNIIKALENTSESKKMKKDFKKLSEDVLTDLWEIMLDYAEISSKSQNLRLNGEKTKVRLITITIDSVAMENIVLDIYEYLCESEEIVDFIEEYEDLLCIWLGEEYLDEYQSLAEAYVKKMEKLEYSANTLCDQLINLGSVSINIATPKMSAKLLKLWVTFGSETVLSLDCGAQGMKKNDTISLEAGDFKLLYKINTEEELSATLQMSGGQNAKSITLSLSVNQERGTYKLVCENKDQSSRVKWTIKGNIDTSGDTTTLTVNIATKKPYDSIPIIPETTYTFKCKVIIDTKDEMPLPSKSYKTIAHIKERDIQAWIEKLGEFES